MKVQPRASGRGFTGIAVLAALLLCAACGKPPASQEELLAREQAAARKTAEEDTARIVKDVQLETLGKRVAALEAEIEQIKGRQAGAGLLNLEQRIAALEVKAEEKPPAPAPPPPPRPNKPAVKPPAPAPKAATP